MTMLRLSTALALGLALVTPGAWGATETNTQLKPQGTPPAASPDLDLKGAAVEYQADLDLLVFEIEVAGTAGRTTPKKRGSMDGAPVLGYVFPTTLKPQDVGFGTGEGTVALAVTAHPDFDDTPLWDENQNRRYDDDGVIYHPHWVLLVPDDRVPGGLSVAEIAQSEIATALPPTNPGMPMLMDSPGFSVVRRGSHLRVLVPASRIYSQTRFRYDAVIAYMEVGPGEGRPLLGVYHVYDVLSGDLSLPFEVRQSE